MGFLGFIWVFLGGFFYCQPCLEGVVVPEVFEEADGLDGLAEAHLVGQDEAVVLAPGVQQEIYPVNLKEKQLKKLAVDAGI